MIVLRVLCWQYVEEGSVDELWGKFMVEFNYLLRGNKYNFDWNATSSKLFLMFDTEETLWFVVFLNGIIQF